MEEFSYGVGNVSECKNQVALNHWFDCQKAEVFSHKRAQNSTSYAKEYRPKAKTKETVENKERRACIEFTTWSSKLHYSVEKNDTNSIIGNAFTEDK